MVEIIVFRLLKHYLIRTDDLLWLNKVKQSGSTSSPLVKLVYFPGSLICQILLDQKKFPKLGGISLCKVNIFKYKEFL